MIKTGNTTDPRARDLDGRSIAPRAEQGQEFKCPGFGATYPAGNEYPAGHIACPWRIRDRHWCRLQDNRDTLRNLERYITRLEDEPLTEWNVEEQWRTAQRIGTLKALIAVDVAEHIAIKEKCDRLQLHATHKANAESKRGPWEFTLTYSPTKHGWSHDEAKAEMRSAIERLTRYYREEIEEFHAVGELTQAGAPHVHAWYRLDAGRRITSKNFRRAYPIWNERVKIGRGHEGGHHEPVKRQADFDGYIEKHLDTAWLDIHITNEPRNEEAHVPTEDDDASEDRTSLPPPSPRSAEPHDG